VSAELNTQVFGADQQQPERSPTPENKKLPKKPIHSKKLERRIFDYISIEQQTKKTTTIRTQEQQKLKTKDQPKDPEPKEEKLTNAEMALTLKTYKMEGLTSHITKEAFPDLTEDELEDAKYIADSVKAGNYRGSAKMTTDKDLQKLLSKHADAIIRERDGRMKTFLEKKYGPIEPPPAEPPQEIIVIPSPRDTRIEEPSNNLFGYL
jgi:hypothetical protein